MKYIRTKDGHVFEAEKDLWLYGRSRVEAVIDMQGNVIDVTSQDNILKEADTIEELCDEVVIVKAGEKPHILYPMETMTALFGYVRRMRKKCYEGYEIYGSIWVGSDLKAVAKMNEKGEFELL